jgi:hypothetical protein
MISVQNVTKKYKGTPRPALDQVSLEIEKWWRPELPGIGEFLDACVELRW